MELPKVASVEGMDSRGSLNVVGAGAEDTAGREVERRMGLHIAV